MHQHSGLALSYLNLYDADAAWRLVHDLVVGGSDRPACAIIKHANPCGVAVADDLATAYQRALECDERSAFGGIVAVNRPLDAATVERMVAGPQADVVIAPGYETGHARRARSRSARTPDCSTRRAPEPPTRDYRQISGGFLVQQPHHFAARSRRLARGHQARADRRAEWRDAELAWRVCGHVKSNAIVLVKDGQAVGIGAGQQNRVESGEIAAKKAAGRAARRRVRERRVLPVPRRHRGRGRRPGSRSSSSPAASMRDEPNIERADELGVAMVFTGERHFLH